MDSCNDFMTWKRVKNGIFLWARILKLYFRAGFVRDNLDKSIAEIRRDTKTPLDRFDAHVFTLSKFVRQVGSYDKLPPADKKIFNELLDTFPVYVEMIKATRERWYLCKIKNSDYPYDVFFAPERHVKQIGTRLHIYSASYIQTKRIQIHPNKVLSKENWVKHLQSEIYRHIQRYDMGFEGSFHFYNTVLIDTPPMKDRDFAAIFRRIKVPRNPKLNSVAISYDVIDTLTNEQTIRTWYIFPLVFPLGALNDSLQEVIKLYVDLDIRAVTMRTLVDKLRKGGDSV